MDDTQQSRSSDAAATRKRRSSILKSQRPARTPFSELEFNVATPTDTAKSRRVSFSRRTGVAEFVTNEATTTWKNFYEEHNRSLESSGNDSDAKASRQPVGHLGKRIFDQQFEEVEVVDFIGTLNPINVNGSLNNVNFTEQLASLDCTADGKLTDPNNKFEFSALTDHHSKIFGNDFTVPIVGEMSGRIEINFSGIQQADKNDDLDEIQRDLERASSNMVCHIPLSDPQNMSEYIEVDLNMTNVATNGEDMSITDTVHSPKVQDVSKSCSIDKKISLSKDWVMDKENIAVNPYVAPRESDNFAINDKDDQVLVYDGKRLTLQLDKAEKDKNKDYRQTLLPNSSIETPIRKTIVLNINDDLPNFVDDMLNSKCENSGFIGIQDLKSTIMYDEEDISMTLAVNRVDIVPKRKTILDNSGNISMTQVLPTNIIGGREMEQENVDRRRTILYEEGTGNISVTQVLPANIITNNPIPERRRTVVYENDTGNISITQAVPTNILVNENAEISENRKTIVFEDNTSNISVTQALSSNVILDDKVPDKRKTIVFDEDSCNVSITQALPANIVVPDRQLQEKRRTIIYDDGTGNISVTQILPTNVILGQNNEEPERRRTIVYEDETGNISVTQALPSNIMLEKVDIAKNGVIPTTQSLPTKIICKDNNTIKRRTIIYQDDTGNISITKAIPTQFIQRFTEDKNEGTPNPVDVSTELNRSSLDKAMGNNRKTIIYDSDCDISMTQAIPVNIISTDDNTIPADTISGDDITNKRKTILFDNDDANISMTQAIPTNVYLLELNSELDLGKVAEDNVQKVTNYETNEEIPTLDVWQDRRKTVVFHTESTNTEMSLTEALPKVENWLQESDKRKTNLFDNDTANISMTKPIPAELLAFQTEILNKSKNKQLDIREQEMALCPDLVVYQAAATHSSPKMQLNKTDQGDLKSKSDNYSASDSEAKVMSVSKVIYDIESKPTKDSIQTDVTSEDQSIVAHPPLEVKSEVLNLRASNITLDIEHQVSDVQSQETMENMDTQITPSDKPQDPVLNALLDMSTSSIESGTDDKNLMARIESNQSSVDNTQKENTDPASSESMFYITRDSDEEGQTCDKEKNKNTSSGNKPNIENRSPLSLEYKDDQPALVDDLEKKLAELKTVVNEPKSAINKFYEKIMNASNPDLEDVVERDENVKLRQQSMTFRKANDTKELLDMISDFTDRKDDNEQMPSISRKGHLAVENKTEIKDPRRLSFAPNRQSIMLSREDLLANISMAQAALQKSRLELDDTESIEDTRDTTIDHSFSHSKSGRVSNEVVKTLHFDDESMSETSLKSSPLKKTAFGETSYMTESKVKVIPTYLKDVSDGIKELMLDLVKPMADTMPFEAGGVDKGVRKVPSTQSTQIQANLITSSQIDIDSDRASAFDCSLIGGGLVKSRSRSFRSPIKFSANSSEKSSEFEVPNSRQRYLYSRGPAEELAPEPVIVFDHLNPLNNILLGSMDYTDAHKYNPRKSDETLCGSEPNRSAQITFKDHDYDTDNVTTHYRIETRLSNAMQGDIFYKQDDEQSLLSTVSKRQSIDRSIDVKVMELKDIEVNTLIAMKGNKELLEASSSLTLVDDAVGLVPDLNLRSKATRDDGSFTHHKVKISRSPVEVIYKIEEQGTPEKVNQGSDVVSNDGESLKNTKPKKRIYSPATEKKPIQTSLDMTPKPITKMQKLSNSPKTYQKPLDNPIKEEIVKMPAEKDVSDNIKHVTIEPKGHRIILDKKRSPRKCKEKKPGTSITVQQLITEYHMDAGINQNILDKQIIEAMHPKSGSSTEPASQSDVLESNSLEVVSSFTSSKNLNDMKDVQSMSTNLSQHSQQSPVPSKGSKVDWHPELISGLSSRNLCETDSGVNVVAKIDMLPFMGSHECEWEPSPPDTWSFRLLHGRLRLSARLAHRHDNSTRTRVRGDTPVFDVTVETIQEDKKNPVALLCVRFACETMRYMVSRATRAAIFARDIPQLLRRCAAVARVALRWGRAMHDAKLHLAYTLDNEGCLTLKVANIPLRSVWEISMRVELVVDDARSVPWPRASDVRVARVVSDVTVHEHDVRRALAHTPRDWGHVPRTIWRMFRYLKHKTRDDDLLLGA